MDTVNKDEQQFVFGLYQRIMLDRSCSSLSCIASPLPHPPTRGKSKPSSRLPDSFGWRSRRHSSPAGQGRCKLTLVTVPEHLVGRVVEEGPGASAPKVGRSEGVVDHPDEDAVDQALAFAGLVEAEDLEFEDIGASEDVNERPVLSGKWK